MLRFSCLTPFAFALFTWPALAQQQCSDGEVYNDDTGVCEVDTGAGDTGDGDGGFLPKLIRFLTPDGGATFTAGTTVAPTGRSSLTLAELLPLDLTILFDRSGSMDRPLSAEELSASNFAPGTRLIDVAKEAVVGLINVLPDTSQLTVIDFGTEFTIRTTKRFDSDGDGNVDNRVTLQDGRRAVARPDILDTFPFRIAELEATGGTALKDAMLAAQGTLNSAILNYPSDDFDREILVLSDGLPNPFQTPTLVDQFIFGAYGDVTTVALPGIEGQGRDFLDDFATNTSGRFVDFSTDPQGFLDAFTGDSTILSGLVGVDITDPDGNTYAATLDALGNFTLNDYALNLGDNTFTATAFFEDNTVETATLTLIGEAVPAVPLPASIWLLAAAVGALGWRKRGASV